MRGFFSINTMNVLSLPCDFNIFFPLEYSIVRQQYIKHIHTKYVLTDCMLLVRLLGNSRRIVVTFGESQKLDADF